MNDKRDDKHEHEPGESGLLGKVASFFVTVHDEPSDKNAPPLPAHAAPPSPAVAPQGQAPWRSNQMVALAPPPAPKADPAMVARLEARLGEAKPPAYAAFMEQYDALAGEFQPHEEARRFRVALKASKTTLDDILGAVDALVSVMENARQEADVEYERKRGEMKSAADQKLATLDEQIKTTAAALQKLQGERDAAAHKLESGDQYLTSTRDAFEAAAGELLSRLHAQKSLVSSMKGA